LRERVKEEEEEEEKEEKEARKKGKEETKERWGRRRARGEQWGGHSTWYSSASSCPRQYSTFLCSTKSDLLPSKIIFTDCDACCKDCQAGAGEQIKRHG
jgi:hypothetical protein